MSNKPTKYKAYEYTGDSLVYSIIEVDEILEKKDKEIAELQAENAQLKKETEFMHSNCKWDAGDGCARLLGEKLAIIDENEKLKQKLENVQASMYADVVDANMENRRLRRALWIARAYRAEARKNYWYARSCHEGDERLWSIDGSAVKYIGCIKRTNFDWLKVWSEVEIKCLKKAEKYK